ncbi:MAG: TetR/AcrR family transcriptional regulator [Polyangiaceae bacterium]|nr:TetR/AcrR family transcriptional regulator [Polyangiaceae bacterium]
MATKTSSYMTGPERRRSILEAARHHFAKNGYHHTNIDHICQHLDISRGTVYLYFSNRRDVFLGILDDARERLENAEPVERVRPPEAGAPTAKKRRPAQRPDGAAPHQGVSLAANELHRSLNALYHDDSSVHVLLRVATGVHPDIDASLRRIEDLTVDRLANVLRSAHSAGSLKLPVEPRRVAMFTVGGAQRLVLDAVSRKVRKVDLGHVALEATTMTLGHTLK